MSENSPARKRARARRTRIALASGVLVAAVAGGAIALTGGGNTPERGAGAPAASVAPQEEPPRGPDLSRRDKDDALAVGRSDAPVVMVEYSDFQCPFCGRFARQTTPKLLDAYVRKGVLRIEFRNFPIFGTESEQAALAAWAAGRQGRFWEFHDVAYAEPRKRDSGAFAKERLRDMAREAGVPDLDRFSADMASDAARAALERDRGEGYAIGVTSTPAFLINGRPVLGAQPTATFIRLVEEARKDEPARKDGDAGAGAGQ